MAHRTVVARWPFHATGRSQDLEPVDPLWKDLQAGLGLAVATLPAPARDHLPHRVDAGAADAGACMILLATDRVHNGICTVGRCSRFLLIGTGTDAAAEAAGGGAAVPLQTTIEETLAALVRDGAVVLTGAAASSVCASVVKDVSAAQGTDGWQPDSGWCGVAAHSATSHSLLADHRVMVLCEGILGAQALQMSQTELESLFTDAHNPPQRDRRSLQMPWELHLSRAAPGNAVVGPHSQWHHGGHRGPQHIGVLQRLAGSVQLDAYWCLQTPTAPVSIEVRVAGEVVSVQLCTGDVLLVRDNIWRRAASSVADGWMLHAGYQLAFLEAEENLLTQYPPHVARDFPAHMQRLVGYTQPYRNLSRFSAGRVNQLLLHDDQDDAGQYSADPAQALEFQREADWATSAAPMQPESTWSQAQSFMLDWDDISESVLAAWCEECLPSKECGPVRVACCSSVRLMSTLLAALYRDGVVVLEDAISLDACHSIIQQLRPYHGKTASRVIGGVVTRSPIARDCALHPVLLALAEGVLGHQCLRPHGQCVSLPLAREVHIHGFQAVRVLLV